MDLTTQTTVQLKVEGTQGEYYLHIPMGSPIQEALNVLKGFEHALLDLEKNKSEEEEKEGENEQSESN